MSRKNRQRQGSQNRTTEVLDRISQDIRSTEREETDKDIYRCLNLIRMQMAREEASVFRRIMRFLEFIAAIVGVPALVISCIQVGQANEQIRQASEQFTQSGPVWTLKVLSVNIQPIGPDGGSKPVQIGVLSNTGRLKGSITGFAPGIVNDPDAKACVPTTGTGDGVDALSTAPEDVHLLDQGQVTLDAGESRLVLFVAPVRAGNGRYELRTAVDADSFAYTPSFDRIRVKVVSSAGTKDETAMQEHYGSMPGLARATENCRALL